MRQLLLKWVRRLMGSEQLNYSLRIPFGMYGNRVSWTDYMEVFVYRDGSYRIRQPQNLHNPEVADRYRALLALVHWLGHQGQLASLTDYIYGVMSETRTQ